VCPLVVPFVHDGMDAILKVGDWIPLNVGQQLYILAGDPIDFQPLVEAMRREGKSDRCVILVFARAGAVHRCVAVVSRDIHIAIAVRIKDELTTLQVRAGCRIVRCCGRAPAVLNRHVCKRVKTYLLQDKQRFSLVFIPVAGGATSMETRRWWCATWLLCVCCQITQCLVHIRVQRKPRDPREDPTQVPNERRVGNHELNEDLTKKGASHCKPLKRQHACEVVPALPTQRILLAEACHLLGKTWASSRSTPPSNRIALPRNQPRTATAGLGTTVHLPRRMRGQPRGCARQQASTRPSRRT
jgi:hypothetical protein